jgi:hypothetical protein
MHLISLVLVASTSLFLAPAVTGTEADPREDLNSLVPHAISLLETKQYVKALEALAEPEVLKKSLEREKRALDEFAMRFGETKAAILLDALRSIRGKKSELSADGTKATFALDQPAGGKGKVVFIKTGKLWSIQN